MPAALRAVARHSVGFRILNRWSWPKSVFGSFAEAQAASRAAHEVSHEHERLVASNFDLSVHRRPSDYPVLFWLGQIARERPITVFDFGGGAGQTYYQYHPLLGAPALASWTVAELPGVVEQGRKIATERGATSLAFTTSLATGGQHTVLLAAGSIHYWERSMADLGAELGGFPDHIIVNRSPFRRERGSFVTVQASARWAVACLVRNLDELCEELRPFGFRLVDHWEVPEKTLRTPWLPDYDAPYHGAYFARVLQP